MDALAKLPAYEFYKSTGIEWLSEIPNEWNVEKAKWLFLRAERPVIKDDGIVTCFRDGQVTLRSNRRTDGFTNAIKEHGYQGIRKGDLVIHAMDAFAGAIGVSDSDGKSTPVYAACVPRIPNLVNPSFYAYYMRDLALSGFIVSLAKGIRERSTDFRFNDFAKLPLPLPSLEIQTKIVSFLDKKTTQIDEAITIKEKQIALLKERKQIIIQKAVTQGLDPNVPMKDSGVDWIGEIPANWEVKQSRYLFRVVRRTDRRGDEVKYSVTQARGLVPTHEMVENSTQAASFDSFQLCHEGDLVLNKYKAHLGVFWKASERGIITNNYTVLSPLDKVSSKYFELLFHTPIYVSTFRTLVYGVTEGMSPLYTSDFYNIRSIVPPLEEQKAIERHVMSAEEIHGEAVRHLEDQKASLAEYKISLINSAVTGKIRITPDMVEA